MKYLVNFLDFITRNRKLLVTILIVLLSYIIYSTFNSKYQTKEIKKLEKQIEIKEELFQEAIKEKERLKDSSEFYEGIANNLDALVEKQTDQIENLRYEKNIALKKVRDVDAFLKERYAHIGKAGSSIVVDKNDGKAIVDELVEKDFLVQEVVLLNSKTVTLSEQVTTLRSSLDFSKLALQQADTAIVRRSEQLEISLNINKMLKEDLNKARKKAFWNNIKGIAIGVGAGFIAGSVAK
jgi:cell division protein FtsB